jgi:uncharacterized membrane protein
MSTPTGVDPFETLAGELAQIGRRLDGMAAQIVALKQQRPEKVLAPMPYAPPPGFAPPGPYRPAPAPQMWAPPSQLPPPVAPAPRKERSAVSGARLVAWTGGAVTLLGVALLMALAASRGWFSPPVRIGAGGVLGAGLVGLGMWLHRKDTAKAGALAVAATGFATLYLVIAGATAGYALIDPVVALVLALLVAGGGLGLADRWQSRLLADGVVVGALLLAPALTTDWLLVALALTMSLAALPVVVHRRWSDLALVVGGFAGLYAAVVCAIYAGDATEHVRAVVLAGATLVIGLATATAAAGRVASRGIAALIPFSGVPALVTAGVLGGWEGAAVAAGAALAMVVVAVLPWLDRVLRLTAVTAGVVAVFQATALAFDGSTFTIVLLGQALTAAVLAYLLRNRLAIVVALAEGTLGLLFAVGRDAPLTELVQRGGLRLPADLVAAAAVSALVLAVAVALVGATGRLGWARPDAATAVVWAPIGVAGLYGVTGLVVNLAVLVSATDGFTAGHAIVTVSWTAAALVLLARGLRRPALRVAGLVLIAAAVGKLVLFDLVALDGLVRVAAFIGAGLILLAAGSRYARLVAEQEKEREPATTSS